MNWTEQALALATALAAGLLIGIERGWKSRDAAEGTRVAGVRTFNLLGLEADAVGLIANGGYPFAGGAVVLASAAIISAGYINGTRLDLRADATSAVAAVTAIALRFLAGIGSPALAIAGAAVVTLILALREEAHGFINRLDAEDVKALARFSVIAAAVLPFLPSGN